jgi:potassium-dependent mechanosensitive channel
VKFPRHAIFLEAVAAVSVTIVLSLGCWLQLYAAEATKIPPQVEKIKPADSAAQAIPAAEIIPRAEQTLRSLQGTRSQVAADTARILNSIRNEITDFAQKSDRRWKGEAETIGELRSLQRLNDVLREWNLEQRELDGWDRALSEQSQILVAQEKSVSQVLDDWRATSKQPGLPKIALQRVGEVLREADAVLALVRGDMAQLLNLQSQLATRREILAKIRKDIDKAREESGRHLLVLDSLPLWEALFTPESQDIIVAQTVEGARRFADDSREFLRKSADRILLHLIFFLALASSLYFLRRGLPPENVERLGGASAIFVLDRPMVTSFLLALIAMPLFYPAAGAALLRAALLPTVIPVLRLLPRLLPKRFRRPLYILLGMYVLDFFRYLLPHDWLLTRALLLLIAIAGCVVCGLFLRSRGTELAASGRERFVATAVRVVFFLFLVSIISNFIGNTTLAEVLVAVPVRSVYAGALIFTGAHLLMALAVVTLHSPPALWLRSVKRHGETVVFRCRALIRLAAMILWAGVTLQIMGLFGDLSAAMAALLQVRWKLGAAEISIQDVAVFCAVVLTTVVLSRLLRFALTEEIFPRIRLPRGVPGAVEVLSRYGVLLLGFFIALAAAGVDLSKVTLLVGALGVGVGFGLQNVVNNFVSGIILVFEHPAQVGDYIEVGPVFGEVRKIGFRASVLRTPDGAEVVIPNGELVGARFINWSLSDWLRRINISLVVAHGTDPNRVIDVLVATAQKHQSVLSEPPSFAVLDRVGESGLHFTLFCWSWIDKFFVVQSELTIAINNALAEAGIRISLPQREIHLQQADRTATAPSQPQADPAENPVRAKRHNLG